MKFVPKAVIAALVGGLRPFFVFRIRKSDGGFIVRARKRQSSTGITGCVDHDDVYDVAGMKEVVVASHNQDTISAVHKIERLSKFFVSHGCMRFATSYASSLYTNLNYPFSGLQFVY